MRSVLLILLCVVAVSCKKIVNDVKRNAILDIMTNGQWYVESYIEDTTDITSQFNGYVFQFKDDNTVTGTKAGVNQQGTWQENISDYSITADFPTAGEPLSKLNGKWVWKDSGNDFVVTEETVGNVKNKLRLRKKP